nr:transposase [Dyadobacter sp. NIV53]
MTTVNYTRGVKNMDWKPFNKKLWQRDYFEHIIRNNEAFDRIANYIINNPSKYQGNLNA